MPRGSPALLQGPSFVRNEAPPYRSPLSSLISERAVGDDASSNGSFDRFSTSFGFARLFSSRVLSFSIFLCLSLCLPLSLSLSLALYLSPFSHASFFSISRTSSSSVSSSSSSLLSFRLELRVTRRAWCTHATGGGGAWCLVLVLVVVLVVSVSSMVYGGRW